MADSWQTAWVEVVPEFSSSFRRSANSEMTSVLGSAGTAGGVVAGQNMSSGIVGSVGKLAGPLLAAFAALGIGRLIGETIGNGIRYGLEGIDLASDLAETRDAVAEIFGSAATGIEKFASTANTQLGQTQQQALDAAKTFGAFGLSAGLSGGELTGFTTELVTLASDLAAFNNTDVDTAIQAIGAALRGESEPIRQYQVLLDDATLKARALEMGIYDGNGALTQQQRVLAAQSEIFAQTAVQQGNFLKTSDNLAGQQKILAASFAEAQTKLGTSLLPTMLLFTTLANDTLVPALNDVVEQVGPQLATALAESAPAFVELVRAIAPLLPELVMLTVEALPVFLQLMTAASPIVLEIVRAIGDAHAVFTALFANLAGDTSMPLFIGTAQEATGVLGAFYEWAQRAGAAVGLFLYEVRAGATSAVDVVRNLPGLITTAVGDLGSLLVSSGRALIQGFINGINAMLAPVRNAVSGVMNYVASFFPHSPAERGPFSGAGWQAVHDAGSAVVRQFSSGLDTPDFNGGSLVGLPRVSNALVSSLGKSSGAPAERPIYADGSLIGWIRELASGEASLAIAGYDADRYQSTRGGRI